MGELRARTIVEAHLYLDLLRADGGLGPDDPGDPEGWTTLVEGPISWILRADGAGGRFAPFGITIAYADLAEARRTGVRFGPGRSTLIDAGQWLEMAEVYVEQAVEAEMAVTGGRDDLREEALLAWRFAVDVAGEVLRFLPEGAAELPDTAFWTERSRQTRRADPERFTRAALEHRVRTYRQLAEDATDLLRGS
ncbi:hypothetical protein [Pseudonocardia humida]|uniref:Uncharacterized protein n=1 Tax=Pseudonocardia humida TaxID=2800819 RepID=A0ABT1A7Z1_9PSEU|nr:hypothetical protein [Pseudonocardia humida]MCO1659137.1 hypothetical protein [Pseudonocardia humida]